MSPESGIGAKTVVVIGTYDERENIEAIVAAVLEAVPGIGLWIVDDSSPDGTGEIADRLAAEHPNVRAYHRPVKSGLGTAYIESFKRAMAEDIDFVVEMDADFSHDPSVLAQMLQAAKNADLVIGSRYVRGGSTPDWTLIRRAISYVGNLVARFVLGIPIHDATTGYRVFNRRALSTLRLEGIRLQGYGFQIETVFQCHRAGLDIVEFPICFIDRRQGQSKMSGAIVVEALAYVFRRRFSELLHGKNRRTSSGLPMHQPDRVGYHDEPAERAGDDQQNVEPQTPAQA